MAKQNKKSKVRKQKSNTRMASGDIIKLILTDHMPLKKLIRVLKNDDKSISERKEAFKQFAPLLNFHSKPEEEVLYDAMKDVEELRTSGFEGEVEHGLADQMVEEAKRTSDTDLWCARVKVLAELVEHHIKEEEDEMLPDFKKRSESEERIALGGRYMRLRKAMMDNGGQEITPESKIRRREPALHASH